MYYRRSWNACLVAATTYLLYIQGIKTEGFNSETTTESLKKSTPGDGAVAVAIKVTTKLNTRQSRSQNNESLVTYSAEIQEKGSPETAHTKSVYIETLIKPESDSEVILTHEFNQSTGLNNIAKSFIRKLTKQPDKEQANDDLKNIKAKKISKTSEQRPHVKYDEVTGELIGGDHPCHRECTEEEEPMTCYYVFHMEWYQTMSKACYNCPFNEADCRRKDCIPADGMNRPLNVINRKMPGPSIEVCKHDRIIVDVKNDLMTEGTTVHWHGQHQRGTPFMDGTPFVTQCPIVPGTIFRYQFNALQDGTHFWHSHSGMQRADGAAGPLIVRQPKSQDPHGALYDYDRSEHVMLVTDWVHELTVSMFTNYHHSSGDSKPPTLLINGVGRFKVFNGITKPFYMRAARFNVERGYKYRFRVINAEFLNCPVELSVVGHNITIIASDGYDLKPITATSLVTYAGERYDIILHANNEIDNYWIRYRGLVDCDVRFTKAKQVAVLHYEGAIESEPDGDPTWEEQHNDGLQVNPLNKGEEDEETISVGDMESVADYDDSLKEVPDYQFYIAYDFYAKNNSHFHKLPYYGYNQDKSSRVYTPQLNHISMKLPHSPLLLSRPSPDNFCNMSSIDKDCLEGYCECSHILSVKHNAVVEIIILDEGTFDVNHPFHLHGYNFRVVGMRRLANHTTIEEVKAFDEAGLLKRNLKNAPLKDTITVPDGGYTVIRFKADNPGYWLFHCHIEFHIEIGMALVFKVGEHKDMAPVPKYFPTCGNYLPDNMVEHDTTAQVQKEAAKDNVIVISHWLPVDPAMVFNGTMQSAAVSVLSSLSLITASRGLLILRFNLI